MNKLPAPSMVAFREDLHIRIVRHAACYSNEHLIDALCTMAHEDPFPADAIAFGLRKLSVSRALLRCPENEDK